MAPTRIQRTITIKSFGEDGEGTFSGQLSPYGNVDEGKDQVEPGAFKKTIADNKGSVPMLWQHKDDEPIGTLELIDTPTGLNVKGMLLLEVARAREAYALIKAGVIDGLSIGYQVLQKDIKEGVRYIKEARLFEGSIVTFPMNLDARISVVKSIGDGTSDFAEALDSEQTSRLGYQILCTLESCLYPVWWNAGYDPDGDVADVLPTLLAYSESVFDQAKEHWLAALAKLGNMAANSDPDMMKSLQLKAKLDFISRKQVPTTKDEQVPAIEEKTATTKRVDGEDLPASAFLIVGDPKTTSTWKLPVHFSTPEKSKSHVRNALARIDQVQGVPAGDIAKAKTKLLALATEMGIDADNPSGKAVEPVPDQAVETPVPEAKAGRKISAETADKLRNARQSMKSADDILAALFSDDGDAAETSVDNTKADETAASHDTDEPAIDHSTGISELLKNIDRLVQTATAA